MTNKRLFEMAEINEIGCEVHLYYEERGTGKDRYSGERVRQRPKTTWRRTVERERNKATWKIWNVTKVAAQNRDCCSENVLPVLFPLRSPVQTYNHGQIVLQNV